MCSMSWFDIPQGIVLSLASLHIVLEPEHTLLFLKQNLQKDLFITKHLNDCIWV